MNGQQNNVCERKNLCTGTLVCNGRKEIHEIPGHVFYRELLYVMAVEMDITLSWILYLHVQDKSSKVFIYLFVTCRCWGGVPRTRNYLGARLVAIILVMYLP